jgi:hypothetical protein
LVHFLIRLYNESLEGCIISELNYDIDPEGGWMRVRVRVSGWVRVRMGEGEIDLNRATSTHPPTPLCLRIILFIMMKYFSYYGFERSLTMRGKILVIKRNFGPL